jgi:hypothetical protein
MCDVSESIFFDIENSNIEFDISAFLKQTFVKKTIIMEMLKITSSYMFIGVSPEKSMA